MTTILFWFSGTGNSLAIARDLAGALDQAELVPIARAITGEIPVAETIGFIFPVYAFGLPGLVSDFLSRILVDPRAYYFTVVTCGGLAGAPHRQAQRILQSKGGHPAAGWTITMPGNYPVLSNPPSETKQRRCFETAQRRLTGIAETIRQNKPGPLEDSFIPFRWISPVLNRMAVKYFHESDKRFIVESTCTQCGLCAKVCPVNNIQLVEKKPTWRHHCEQCMACLQWCPVEAIQYGRSTKGRKRYHHPLVDARDLFLHKEKSA